MQSHVSRILTAGLAVVLTSTLFGQAAEEAPQELPRQLPPGFQLPPQLARIAFWERSVWTMTASARFTSTSANVSFANVGVVPVSFPVPGADQGSQTRAYDDGGVIADGVRPDEKLDDGTVFSTPGGRYAGNGGDGLFLGDYLAYTPGQTRYWRYFNQDQIVPGGVEMHSYSATSTGAAFGGIDDTSPVGFDLQISRRAVRLSERTEINFSAAFGLSNIKARNSGTVVSDLEVMTDLYQIYGTAPTAPTTFPTYAPLLDDNGNIILDNGTETTAPLQEVTANRTFSTVANGATVDGEWELKGAYYAVRLGPQLRSHLSESFAVTVGAGVGGAWVGTDFDTTEVIQTIQNTERVLLQPIGVIDRANHSDFIFGFYAEASAEYWFTPRTAISAGVVYESMGEYKQVSRGRTATVDIGSGLVARIGITTRF